MASSSSPTAPAPTVPAPELRTVTFSSKDVPITAVTVFRKDKAEVTRVVKMSASSGIGPHEVELAALPGQPMIDKASVRVKGSGHCTILHVTYSDKAKEVTEPKLTEEEEEAAKAETERVKRRLQQIKDEDAALSRQSTRNQRMRKFADSYAERVVAATADGSENAAAASGTPGGPVPSVVDVGKALDWWAAKAVETDMETARLELEERKIKDAVAELAVADIASARQQARKVEYRPRGRVLVSVDVHELGPIELEVTYMIRGATWSPAYDLRVDTETDSLSCTYFGRVTQSTTEDWEGVALRLSTAEPTLHGTPPVLGIKTISLKVPPPPDVLPLPPPLPGMGGGVIPPPPPVRRGPLPNSSGGVRQASMSRSRATPSAPPPLPEAKPAVAQVENGGGGIGAVSFVIVTPAVIKSGGSTKKLTIGELQLSSEVTHYVVPSKKPAAYLQAKATNDTDYLLLASGDVSIFFGNSLATKTSLESVSPGETFRTFLGIDPSVKVKVAPPRKTSRKRGLLSKSNHVTSTQSTSISNKKKVPVTCVVVDAMPRSADEAIKVVLQEPAPSSVSNSEAITDEVLVSGALEMFGGPGAGGGGEGSKHHEARSRFSLRPSGSAAVTTRVAGVVKSPSNHLAWVGTVAPQGELSIPFEYVTEWPIEKETEIIEK